MRNMAEFYATLPVNSPILAARWEHAKYLRIFEEDETKGEEIPRLFAAATRLRSELEALDETPGVVGAYIKFLAADVNTMRRIISNLRGGHHE